MSNFILISLLIRGSYTDFKTRIIEDYISVGLFSYALIMGVFTDKFPLKESLFGFLLGGMLLIFFSIIGAMGFGDVKLMSALGAWFGYQIIEVFLLSFILGSFIALYFFFFKKNEKEIPFGPAISLAAVLIWFFDFKIFNLMLGV